MLFGLITAALAGVRFERVPAAVEQDPLGDQPVSVKPRDYADWMRRATDRAALANLDAAVRWTAEQVDACASATSGAASTIQVSVATSGETRVTVEGGDATLAGCVAQQLDGQLALFPLARGVRGTYTVQRDGAGPDPAPAPAPPADATGDDAFAPTADRIRGFGAVPFGGRAADFEGMERLDVAGSVTVYKRLGDSDCRWLGATCAGVNYAFGEDGLVGVTLGVSGGGSWRIREMLTARFGAARWDQGFKAWYWRGEQVLVHYRQVPGGDQVLIGFADISRARAAGLSPLPGDRPVATDTDPDRRLPRIIQSQ